MDLGLGKTPNPFPEKIAVEDKIPLSPANQHRRLPEPIEIFLGLLQQSIGKIGRSEGDVLDKAQRGDSVLPGVIRGPVSTANPSGHRFSATQIPGNERKGVESQDEELSHLGVSTQGKGPVKRLSRRQEKGSRV